MRRAAPFLIIAIAILAIIVNFVAIPVPASGGETRRLETKLGLDLRGGLRIEYQVLPAEGKTPTRDDLNIMREIIINRIDRSGVAEPQVVVQGSDRIIVEMPGVQNPDQIRELVGTTGRLDFVPLGQTQMTQDQDVAAEVLATNCDESTTDLCVLFSGDQVAAAQVGANQTGQRTVNFTLTGNGKDKFAQYTADHVGDYFAIVLDGKFITAPVINSSIPN